MTGSEKILQSIKVDSENLINGIVSETNEKIADITEKARRKADSEVEKITSDFNKKAAQLRSAAQSSAALAQRNAILSRKREEINKTIDSLVSYLGELNEKDYFELFYKAAAKMPAGDGEVLLNEKDLNRLPEDFAERMKAVGIDCRVSPDAHKIGSGFILRRGKIELSAEFSAIAQEKREELEDFINSSLFEN